MLNKWKKFAQPEKYAQAIEDAEKNVIEANSVLATKERELEKLKERKEEVQVGDRIPYIFIECSDSKIKKSELAEDPKYAELNGLKFNRLCYLEQLAKPILGFYRVVLKDNESLLDDTIDYVNRKITDYGGKKLRASDFKIE